jgi:Leucine zipper with capping helix domain
LLDAQRGREEDSVLEPEVKSNEGVFNDDEDNATNGKREDEEPNTGETPVAKKPKLMNRAQKLQRLQEIAQFKTAALAELESLKENDPQAIADLEHELHLVHQAANRWTDNIYNCQSYLTKKRGMGKKEAMKLLGITDTFDCRCFPRRCCTCVAIDLTMIYLFIPPFLFIFRPRR